MIDENLSQAELFDVFSNARRRGAVRYLKQQGGACDLSPLVEQVAAWENDVPVDEVTRAQRRRVYISLYQTHLPMLEDHGIVDWDPDGHRIELLVNEQTFEPYLDRSPERQRSWHTLYASISVAGTLALGLTALSVGPLSTTAAPAVALAVSLAVLVVAAFHHRSRRPGYSLPIPTSRR